MSQTTRARDYWIWAQKRILIYCVKLVCLLKCYFSLCIDFDGFNKIKLELFYIGVLCFAQLDLTSVCTAKHLRKVLRFYISVQGHVYVNIPRCIELI